MNSASLHSELLNPRRKIVHEACRSAEIEVAAQRQAQRLDDRQIETRSSVVVNTWLIGRIGCAVADKALGIRKDL